MLCKLIFLNTYKFIGNVAYFNKRLRYTILLNHMSKKNSNSNQIKSTWSSIISFCVADTIYLKNGVNIKKSQCTIFKTIVSKEIHFFLLNRTIRFVQTRQKSNLERLPPKLEYEASLCMTLRDILAVILQLGSFIKTA